MSKVKLPTLALLAGALISSGMLQAQSTTTTTTTTSPVSAAPAANNNALINALIAKGILTPDDAAKIEAEINAANAATAASSAGSDIISNPTDKYVKKITLSGRFQTQFVDLGTSIDGYQNAAPSVLPAHPVASEHFLLRRIYLGTKVDFIDGFSGVVNYDFANASFDAAYVGWKQSDALEIDAGFKKVPFDYEEITSSGDLKAIERSPVTRYFDEPNNGRRLGAASYRTGLFANGTEDGFFWAVAVTNPERNEYSGDSTSGPSINGDGGVGNYSNSTDNNLAYYGWGGWSTKFKDGSFKIGGEYGDLPDQGGPAASALGQGDNLSIYGLYADVTEGVFRLQGEWMTAEDKKAVTVAGKVRAAKPNGYWVQPSIYLIPKKLEAVVRYSELDSDNRGVALSDGIRGATSGGTMDKMNELYIGGNWYIEGNDVKLQFGYIHGVSMDPLAPTTPTGVVATGTAIRASTNGFRSQVQVNF